MDWIITLLVGALIGWVASMIMKTDAQQGALMNIIIGIIGAALGRWLFAGVLGIGAADVAGAFTIWGLIWGIVGAVILIGILKAVKVLH